MAFPASRPQTLADKHRGSAARLYWENKLSLYNAADIFVPAAVSVFPGENYQAPRSWTERAYRNLICYNKLDKGGHFAAWGQPRLFSPDFYHGSGVGLIVAPRPAGLSAPSGRFAH